MQPDVIVFGMGVSPQQPKTALQRLRTILDDPKYTAQAEQFATRHQGFYAKVTRDRLVNRIEELATGNGQR